MSLQKIIAGDLYQLHTLRDAWSHSYLNDNGEREMWGKSTNYIPLLGRITLEHKFAGGHGDENADNIAKRPEEYSGYINSLVEVFTDKKFAYNNQVTNAKPNLTIFDYVQKNGGSKDANIFLLQSYIELNSGTTRFSSKDKSLIEKFKGYLDQQGLKYVETSNTIQMSSGTSPTTGASTSQGVTTYTVDVLPKKDK